MFGASEEVAEVMDQISDKSAFINEAVLFYAAHKAKERN